MPTRANKAQRRAYVSAPPIALGSGRLADGADRPVRGGSLARGVGEHSAEIDDAGRLVDSRGLHDGDLVVAQHRANDVEAARQGRIAEGALSPSPARPERIVAVSDFPGLRARLGPWPRLRPEPRYPGIAEQGGKLRPGIRRAHIDDANSVDAWPRRLGTAYCRSEAVEPAPWGQNAVEQALQVSGGERKRALPNAWWCARLERSARQQERLGARPVYARSHRGTPATTGVMRQARMLIQGIE